MSEQRAETFPSTSAKRTSNNLMRHEYRALSPGEKEAMQRVKDMGLAFVQYLHVVGGSATGEDLMPERQASRELSIAATKIEEAVMWAVKHVTR